MLEWCWPRSENFCEGDKAWCWCCLIQRGLSKHLFGRSKLPVLCPMLDRQIIPFCKFFWIKEYSLNCTPYVKHSDCHHGGLATDNLIIVESNAHILSWSSTPSICCSLFEWTWASRSSWWVLICWADANRENGVQCPEWERQSISCQVGWCGVGDNSRWDQIWCRHAIISWWPYSSKQHPHGSQDCQLFTLQLILCLLCLVGKALDFKLNLNLNLDLNRSWNLLKFVLI